MPTGLAYSATPLHLASREHLKVSYQTWGRFDGPQQGWGASITARQASILGQVEIARIPIKRRAGVTAKDNDEDSPLHLMSRWEQELVARLLTV